MSVFNYATLKAHVGHSIVCVQYGAHGTDAQNVAIECEDCMEVLLDFDAPESTTNRNVDPNEDAQ